MEVVTENVERSQSLLCSEVGDLHPSRSECEQEGDANWIKQGQAVYVSDGPNQFGLQFSARFQVLHPRYSRAQKGFKAHYTLEMAVSL